MRAGLRTLARIPPDPHTPAPALTRSPPSPSPYPPHTPQLLAGDCARFVEESARHASTQQQLHKCRAALLKASSSGGGSSGSQPANSLLLPRKPLPGRRAGSGSNVETSDAPAVHAYAHRNTSLAAAAPLDHAALPPPAPTAPRPPDQSVLMKSFSANARLRSGADAKFIIGLSSLTEEEGVGGDGGGGGWRERRPRPALDPLQPRGGAVVLQPLPAPARGSPDGRQRTSTSGRRAPGPGPGPYDSSPAPRPRRLSPDSVTLSAVSISGGLITELPGLEAGGAGAAGGDGGGSLEPFPGFLARQPSL